MQLFTLNGVYPNKDFDWIVNPESLGFSDESHFHVIQNIDELSSQLENKIEIDHNHIEYIRHITINSSNIYGSISIIFNNINYSILNNNLTITIDNLADETSIVGINNVNNTLQNKHHQTTTYDIGTELTPIANDTQVLFFLTDNLR